MPQSSARERKTSGNLFSQHGEDRVIERMLATLGAQNHYCVEFGAWDGRHLSNTYNLVCNHEYTGVMIEGEKSRFLDLEQLDPGKGKVIPINAFVGFTAADGLDSILAPLGIPTDFDVLSIDIDGNDYHVWSAITKYRPKVVVIEFNPTIPNPVEFVQPRDENVNQGCSLRSLVVLGKTKDYELAATTKNNAFFVDSRVFHKLGISDNSLDTLRTDYSDITYIFNGYDGTVFIRGRGKLKWHHYPYKESRLQSVPRWLRQFPSNYGPLKKRIAKLYSAIQKKI